MLNLRIYEPVLYSTNFLEDISEDAILTWRRSTRSQGGYWRGSFTLYGDANRLAKFFYERLACHLVERWGGSVTWEGLIYEMDLTIGGTTRRRSLDMMANYISLAYTDNNNESILQLGKSQSANSIKWFGRREELLTLDYANDAGIGTLEPQARCDTYLKDHAWAQARPVGVMQGDNQLVVTVCGYAFTSNWRYETVGDDSTDDASTYITELITTDCEWLKVGRIGSNALQIIKGVSIPTRVFDVISDITILGDQSGDPWRFYIDNGQYANYQQIDTTPQYYLRGGELYSSVGGSKAAIPWMVKPCVIRDTSYPVSKWNYQGWLSDARDIYIDEVEVGPGGLVIKTDLFEESEILAAQSAYQNSIESLAPAGIPERKHIWELLGYSKAQRLGMTDEEWQRIKRAAQKRKRETGKFK